MWLQQPDLRVWRPPLGHHEEIHCHKHVSVSSNVCSPSELLKVRLGLCNLSSVFGAKSRMTRRVQLLTKLLGILAFSCLWITAEAQIKIPPET